MRALALALLCPLLVLCAAAPADGQLIRGRILVDDASSGASGAEVALLDVSGVARARATADSTGAFALSVPEPGLYVITASRIGLAPVRAAVTVGEKEVVEVELRTTARAVPLNPIEVVARRTIRRGTLDEFYDRMERMKQKGEGTFLTREDLRKRERMELALALEAAPGVLARSSGGAGHVIRMMGPGGVCTPDVYLDGLPLTGSAGSGSGAVREPPVSGIYPWGNAGGGAAGARTSSLQVMDLEGVEVYRGRFEKPDDYWPSTCGIVMLWRKRDWGEPFAWKTLFVAGGLGGLLVLLGTAIF